MKYAATVAYASLPIIKFAVVAQSEVHVLGKDEATGSIPVNSIIVAE